MPQELKQVNGRWVVTGAQQSSDLAPTVRAGFKPGAGKPQGRPKPPPRPWWSKLWNDLQYEFKRPQRPLTRRRQSATDFLLGQTAVGNLAIHKGSLGQNAALGLVGASDNALKMAHSLAQRHVQKKPKADPTSGSFGNALSQGVEAAYRALGAKPPSQMSQDERNVDQMRRSVALNVALAPVTPGLGAARAATAIGMGLRGGAAFAFNEALSTYLDDQTSGNVINLINGLTGANLPGAVNVGQDDMVDAANKSLLPNAATSLGIGLGAGAAVAGFRNIRRNTRAHRAVQREVQQRAKQESMGILQKDEADGLDFTPQTKQPAEPTPPPEPTFQEANAAMEQRLGMNTPEAAPAPAAAASAGDQIDQIFAGMGKGLTEGLDNAVWEGMQGRGAMRSDPIVQNLQKAQGLIGRPLDREEALALAKGVYAKAGPDSVGPEHWIAQLQEQFGLAAPAKASAEASPIPTIDNATAENLGKAQAADLPEGDPTIDYWDYDPDLPESTALGKALEDLSDAELQTVLSAPELDVVERVNQVIEARAGIEPRPPVAAQMVMAPTDRLADDYLETVTRKLGAREDYELRPLFDPEVNPELWQRAQALTGVDDAAQLSKADMLDSLTAMAADGQAPIVNRMMGGQMLPTGEVQAAPLTFQYKGGVNDAGEQIGNSLEGVERWDPSAEGIIQVWRDANGEIGQPGTTYVVNGHNRLAAAKRMGIPSMRVEYLDSPTAAEARLQGAISNVSDGKGTVFDAAKLAREYGITDPAQLKAMGKPGASGFWKEGIALGRLPEDVFTAAVNEQIPLRRAVIIGESGADEETMRSAYRYLVQQGPENVKEGTLREMLAMARSSPAASSSGGRQKVLFEGTEWEQSFNEGMLAKADLASAVRQMLSKEKKLFGTVGRQAEQIERVGQVDAGAAKDISGEASRALTIFDELKYLAGPVGDLLNEGTQRVLAGESAAQVAKGIKNRLAASIAEAMGKEVAPAVDVVQEDMFAAATRAAEPIELTPDERLAAEAQLLQQAAASGKIRPPSAPIPDLPEPAQVRLDQIAAGARPGMELYHGTTKDAAAQIAKSGFRTKANAGSTLGEGVYFFTDPSRTARYGPSQIRGLVPGDIKILDLFAEGRNVASLLDELNLSATKQQKDAIWANKMDAKQLEAVRKYAIDLGYDGIRYDPSFIDPVGKAGDRSEVVIFDPKKADRLIQFERKAAQATADEIRLAVEHKQADAALQFEQQQALRDATEYEALTFDEKKDLGLAADLDEVITPEVLPPENKTPIADALGATLRAMAESDARLFRGIDQLTKTTRQAIDELSGGPVRPVRPEPLRLTASAPQPEFTLPKELSKASPRYGRAEIRFESDLDRVAYALANDAVKPSKAAGKFRQVVREAGLNLDEVVAHGKQVKAALKQAAKSNPGQIELPAQPWRSGAPMASPQLFDDLEDPATGPSLERLLFDDAPPAEREQILQRLGNERLEGVWTLGQVGATDRLEKDILEFVQRMTGGRMTGSRIDADIADAVFVRTNNAGYGGGGIATPEQVGGVNADHIYNEAGAVLLITRYDNLLNKQGLAEMAQTGAHEAIHFLQARRLTQKQLEVLSSDEAVTYFRAEAGKARKWGGANDLKNIELMAWGSQRVIAARLLRDMESLYRSQGLSKHADYVAKVRIEKLGEYKAPPTGVEKALEPLIELWERIKNYLLGAGFKRNSELTTEQLEIIGRFTDAVADPSIGLKGLAKAIDPRTSMPPKEVQELLDAAYVGQIGKQMYLRPGRMGKRALANYERRWDVLGVSPSDYDSSALPPTNVGAQRVRQQIDANNQTIDDIRRKAQQEGC